MTTIAPPTTEAEEAVHRGAALLDEYGPENWRELVDGDRLNMGHCQNCVLGQVYGYYIDGLNALGIQDGGSRYGFTIRPDTLEAWRAEIAA